MPKSKRMRLPNGFGQISEIKNAKLRKPFRAMITVGKSETGRPICKLLKPDAYFRTYNEAYQALMKYHENPYDLCEDTTANTIFDRWYKEHCVDRNLSYSALTTVRLAWQYCKDIHNIPIKDIRGRHIKYCMENGTATVRGVTKSPDANTKRRIKSVFNNLFDYAIEYDLVDKNYARAFDLSREVMIEANEVESEHIPYTDEEMLLLWSLKYDLITDMILVQCYSGWRPAELIALKISDIDLENWSFTGGVKTESGKNRTVPIHSKIKEIVSSRYTYAVEHNCRTLFTREDTDGKTVPLNYNYFIRYYNQLKEDIKLDPRHRPHDGRKHFITQAKKYNVDEYVIKRLVGHSIRDITEKVYTERDLEWLRSEIEKIK